MTANLFDWAISPLRRDAFLNELWGKSFHRIPGQTGKFESLLPWSELNSILEHYSLASLPAQMFHDGKAVDPRRFSTRRDGRDRLKLAGVINCLAEGATLILDQVDEMAPAVRTLAQAFEEVLHTDVCVNLYAGWRDKKGFDLHWDPQDTMILQVSGRKHWKVFPPTRLHPIEKGQDVELAQRPTGEPAWEGILENGDMIYLPRGWWHVAFPLNEPSLHLTVTTIPANGVDFLKWFVHRLKRHVEVRKDVPFFAGKAERKEYLRKMRELLAQAWSDDLLERFADEWEARIPLRPHLRLPFAPMEQAAPITIETHIRLATARRLVFDETGESDTLGFSAGDVRGECAAELVTALKALSGTTSRSVRELSKHLEDEASTQKLMMLLTTLAMRGAVWLERSGEQ